MATAPLRSIFTTTPQGAWLNYQHLTLLLKLVLIAGTLHHDPLLLNSYVSPF
jgi:hypothetical protein